MNKNIEQYRIEHILIADDDQDHIELFKKIVSRDYPEVRISSVNDGDSLLKFIHLYAVDLIFLDLHMPCMNGYECLTAIRKEHIATDTPVIVYSSSAQLSDIQRCFANRADFYLVKPFHTEHLRTALSKIMSVNWKEDDAPMRLHYFMNNRFVPYTQPT